MSIKLMEVIQQHWEVKDDCQKSTSSQTSQDNSFQGPFKKKQKEKTQLCKKYMERGFCPYKDKCKFAHGTEELRCNNHSNNRYKTKQCAAFFKNGHCPYGERCNFLHACKESKNVIEIWSTIKHQFRDVIQESRTSSRFF